MSPAVMRERLAKMSLETPLGAAMAMQGFALEKTMAGLESGAAVWMEMMRLSVGSSLGEHTMPGKAAEGIAAAALHPMSKRVRANASRKPKQVK